MKTFSLKALSLNSLLNLVGAAAALAIATSAFAGTNPGPVSTGPIVVGNVPPFVQIDHNPVDLLQPYVTFVTTKPNGAGTYEVGFTLVSNRKDNEATYATGVLTYSPAVSIPNKGIYIAPHLSGDGSQYFSDRLHAGEAACDPNSFHIDQFPFDPNSQDKVNLNVATTTGQVTLILKSQGNKQIVFNTTADSQAGVLYGFGSGVGQPRTMYVLSFSKIYQPIIH